MIVSIDILVVTERDKNLLREQPEAEGFLTDITSVFVRPDQAGGCIDFCCTGGGGLFNRYFVCFRPPNQEGSIGIGCAGRGCL